MELNNKKLVELVKQSKIVLVIGEDMFYHESNDGKKESLQEYIVNAVIQDKHLSVKPEMKERMFKEGYHGLSLLFDQFRIVKQMPNNQRNYFNEIVENVVYREIDNIHIDDILKTFLEEGVKRDLFPLIVTTSPFDIIERELGFVFLPQYSDTTKLVNSKFYHLGASNSENLPSKVNIVYHLFGCATSGQADWVSTELKLIHFLHSMHANKDFCLPNALKQKNLFIIGCSLPDWLFRFMLYPLDNSNVHERIWLNSGNLDDTSLESLEELDYQKGELTPVLEALTTSIKSITIEKIKPEKEVYDIFVSHCQADKEFAQEVVFWLRAEFNLNVWVDFEHEKELLGNDWGNIKDALSRSLHVMPLFTAEYVRRFASWMVNVDNEEYLNDSLEWITFVLLKMVKNNKISSDFIIPIVKDKDNIRTARINEVLNNSFIQSRIDQDKLPQEFDGIHRYSFYQDMEERENGDNSFHKQPWDEMCKEGNQMTIQMSEKSIDIEAVSVKNELLA